MTPLVEQEARFLFRVRGTRLTTGYRPRPAIALCLAFAAGILVARSFGGAHRVLSPPGLAIAQSNGQDSVPATIPFDDPATSVQEPPTADLLLSGRLTCSGDWCQTKVSTVGIFESDGRRPVSVVADHHDEGTHEGNAGNRRVVERRIYHSKGTLRADVEPQPSESPVVVVTPHVQIVVIGTRFDVQVDDLGTTVDLIKGKVRLENASGTVEMVSGQRIHADGKSFVLLPGSPQQGDMDEPVARAMDLPPEPARPDPGIARVSPEVRKEPRKRRAKPGVEAPAARDSEADCRIIESREARIACLETLSRGSGPEAEQALYHLAMEINGRSWRDGSAALEIGDVEAFERRYGYDARFEAPLLVQAVGSCSVTEFPAIFEAILSRLEASSREKTRRDSHILRECAPLHPGLKDGG